MGVIQSLSPWPGLFAEDVVPDHATAYPYLLLYESRQRHYLSTPPDGTPCSKDRFLAYLRSGPPDLLLRTALLGGGHEPHW